MRIIYAFMHEDYWHYVELIGGQFHEIHSHHVKDSKISFGPEYKVTVLRAKEN